MEEIKEQCSDLSALSEVNSKFMSTFTQLATSTLNVVRSAQCENELQITGELQILTRDVMKSSKKFSKALKSEHSKRVDQARIRSVRQQGKSTLDELLNDSTSGYEV